MNAKKHSKITLTLITVLWPAFLAAGAATVLFFALFDPLEFIRCDEGDKNCRLKAYSIGFLFFWAVTIGSSWLTCYFNRDCDKN